MAAENFFCLGRRFLLMTILLAGLQGCASGYHSDSDSLANTASMKRADITAGLFQLITYSRIRNVNAPVTIYVEGDVRGWVPLADPGLDATPDEELGLKLASTDPATNVVFIAQPCQFGINDPACADPAWSNGLLAERIITGINRAIDHIVVVFPHPHINLVGYSGGGAVATVLAARRHDVVSLRTIAGNLDPDASNRYHAADPQDDFIAPMEVASRLALLPQEHFVGDKDYFVPPFLTENFIKAIGPSRCVHVTHIENATHKTGWESFWEQHAGTLPTCGVTAQ
jgi:hypothetical protein